MKIPINPKHIILPRVALTFFLSIHLEPEYIIAMQQLVELGLLTRVDAPDPKAKMSTSYWWANVLVAFTVDKVLYLHRDYYEDSSRS